MTISAFREVRLLIINTMEVSPSWFKMLMHFYKLLTFSRGFVRAKQAAVASALVKLDHSAQSPRLCEDHTVL